MFIEFSAEGMVPPLRSRRCLERASFLSDLNQRFVFCLENMVFVAIATELLKPWMSSTMWLLVLIATAVLHWGVCVRGESMPCSLSAHELGRGDRGDVGSQDSF